MRHLPLARGYVFLLARGELFVHGDHTRKAITFYDLRATGITWMALRADNPMAIKQRAGHCRFETTEGDIREAENLRAASVGEPFPALLASLLGSGQVLASITPMVFPEPKARMMLAERAGFESGRATGSRRFERVCAPNRAGGASLFARCRNRQGGC